MASLQIRSIAREPGETRQSGSLCHPTGNRSRRRLRRNSRGVRIQAIVKELHDEKIDVIEWNADPAIFIGKKPSVLLV